MGGPAGRQVTIPTFARKALRAAVALPSYLRLLRRELRRMQPDVIHTNGFKMHLCGIWSRPGTTPVVWHIHDYLKPRPVMRRLLRMFASRCAGAVANSDSVARDVAQICGPGLTVSRVYNAVDLQKFRPSGPAVDLDRLSGMPPAPDGTIRVGLLATFARWKGHQVFLRALAQLPEAARVRGYLIGGPLYQSDGGQHSLEELRRMVTDLEISDRVGFTGFIEEPAAALRSLDIVVHTSTEPEPFGLVIAEAMACGRAAVVSRTGGAEELISDQHDALGSTPGDAAALAQSIRQLATDGGLRARLGRAARLTAERRFDRRRLAWELVPIYESLRGAC